jgi:Tfp pilus assembly protein PilF
MEPNNALVFNNRGIFHFKNNNPAAALADLTKAIALNPRVALAYRSRAAVYKQLGEHEKAVADEKTAASLEN